MLTFDHITTYNTQSYEEESFTHQVFKVTINTLGFKRDALSNALCHKLGIMNDESLAFRFDASTNILTMTGI